MNTILSLDIVILTKEMNGKVKKVGEVFEIANVIDGAFVLRDAKTKVAIGVVSFEDFDKYFVREEEFKGWTSWTPLTGFDGQTDALYRTNKKKVQVKFLTDGTRAEAACCKGDDFNLFFGIQIAYLRCMNKALEKKKKRLEEEVNLTWQDIADNKNIIKRMVNSLES